jgi:hypothetical protein
VARAMWVTMPSASRELGRRTNAIVIKVERVTGIEPA